MTSQSSKLYRSNVNYMPVTVVPPKDFNMTQELPKDVKFSRQVSIKNTLASTGSHAHMKSKHLNQSIELTKQTIPNSTGKDAQNTSFMSIDEIYLNPKFQKKKDFPLNRILPNNLTDLQSDTQSSGGRSIKTYQGQEDYYKYWKSKAHQYLEENFKLREENKKLKNEMDSMKQQISRQGNVTPQNVQNMEGKERENKSFAYLEGIFKKKLDELQHSLQQKTFKIITLEDKILELNRKLLGEEQRTQLLERLGSQIDVLTQENILLKTQLSSIQNQSQPASGMDRMGYENGVRSKYRSKEKVYGSGRKISMEKVQSKR